VGFAIFALGSALWAVLWMVFENSIQDAFAVAGYIVNFAVVAVGFTQAMVEGLGKGRLDDASFWWSNRSVCFSVGKGCDGS
jgi:hypothetical protein